MRPAPVNLALFPITALLLLLSGVGSPLQAADGHASATALIQAILLSGAEVRGQGRRSQAAPQKLHQHPAEAGQNRAEAGVAQPAGSSAPVRLGGGENRKAYRTRFGFAEGAHQPQGPPAALAGSFLG